MSDYGAIRTSDDLIAVLRARRMDLGLSHLDVDDLAGLQDGYTGKIECGTRGLSMQTLAALLGALGCVLRLERAASTSDIEVPVAWTLSRAKLEKKIRERATKGGIRRWGESLPHERKIAMRKVTMARLKAQRERASQYGNAGKNPAKG